MTRNNVMASNSTEHKSDQKMIHVEMEHKNCSAEVYINDIPLDKYDAGDQPFISIPAHEYLIDGINKLELVVNPGPTPSHAKRGSLKLDTTSIFGKARLVRYPVGVFTGDPSAEVLAEVIYRGKKGNQEMFPKVLSTNVDLGPMFGHWAWQDAETVMLDRKTVDSVMNYVKVIQEAYGKGDGELIIKKSKIELDETHRAYPARNRANSERLFIRDMQENSILPGWKIEPLNSILPDLRVVANGKMIEAIARDWKPLVRTKPIPEYNNDVFDYQMFLSKINGEWQIVR